MAENKLEPCSTVGIDMPKNQFNEREICESAVIEAWNRRADTEKKIRNEAIKEFAERLKNTMSKLEGNSQNKIYEIAMNDMLFYYVPKIIDDVVEEMMEV